MAAKDFAVRKRQMLNNAHKTMFIIVALTSTFVGMCLVLNWFLIKKMIFNQKVIATQNTTIDTLGKNYNSIKKIDEGVNVLKTSELLNSKKVYKEQSALQVILDALPDRANTLALGESLRRSILNVPDIEIEQMSIVKTDDETGNEFIGQSTTAYNEEYEDVTEPSIYFRLKITGTAMGLNQVLKNAENSIRPIFIDKIEFQSSTKEVDDRGRAIPVEARRHWMAISARSFYSYGIKPEMVQKVIKE